MAPFTKALHTPLEPFPPKLMAPAYEEMWSQDLRECWVGGTDLTYGEQGRVEVIRR